MLILSLALLETQCEPYEKLNNKNKCVHICIFPNMFFNLETGKCAICKPTGSTRGDKNTCVCKAGFGFSDGKCTKCGSDSIKIDISNTPCTLCENYEESNNGRTECFNKCSKQGQTLHLFLNEEGVCQNCTRNMFVKDNQCHCIAGFVEEVHMTGVECVQERGTAKVKKQSEAVAMGILIVIFALHAVGITWYVVSKIFRAKMNKLQGIKSA